MATPLNFTKLAIESLPLPSAGRVEYHDTKLPGLQLRVTATGIKTFCVFKRVKGSGPERITLGRFPDLTVEKARRDATQVLAAIASGANPAEAKRAHRGELTFAELFRQYIDRHAKIHKKTASEDEQRYTQYLEKPLGKKKLTTITRQVISSLHAAITSAGHPVVANRVLALLSTVFGRAVEWSIVENNPAKGIRRNPEKSRDRFIQTDEMQAFFLALSEESNTTIRDYLTLSLFTGARRANLLEMPWRNVSFTDCVWRIPDTKNGTPQNIPLTPEAIEILEERNATRGDSEFVFPGDGAKGHLAEPRKGWLRILHRAAVITLEQRIREAGKHGKEVEQARDLSIAKPAVALADMIKLAEKYKVSTADVQLEDLRIHDLRRTFGSFQAKSGASSVIIGKSLNHKSQQTTSIYSRLDMDPVRASVEKGTDLMLAAAGRKKPQTAPMPIEKPKPD